MNIPEEAVEAAAEGVLDAAFGQELPESPIDLARAALEAALPHLEAALRTQIAADIRQSSIDMQDAADTFAVGSYSGTVALKAEGMSIAARIAEKEATK